LNTRVRGVSDELGEAARRLKGELTPAERRLWEPLRDRRIAGVKFWRQHAVGPFVLDCYRAEYKLAVEVDGPVHDSRQERDAARTDQLAANGYFVLRIRNDEVFQDLDGVLARIAAAIEARRVPTPAAATYLRRHKRTASSDVHPSSN
jgi:very-short-patch-repair endonuclease